MDATDSQHGVAAEDREMCRVDPAALPRELRHGPSRRFLVDEGLPESAADLDFTVLWEDGELRAFDDDRRLFVIGETDYCGTAVVLDGVSGEVYLACREAGEIRRDVLATGLAALAGLIREMESLSAGADETAYDGRYGPAVVAEVVEAAERRMRAVDPRLFDLGTPVVHWGTSLLVRSLRWGARPGEPGGLAYAFGPELIEDLAVLAGEGRVRRFRPEELPAGLTHGPTRRLLADLGLPLDGEIFGACEEPLLTMGEAHPETFADDASPGADDAPADRAYQRDFFAIGWWPHDLVIALDGATGRLELPDWYDDGEPHAYLNRDLSALLYALWTYERMRAEWYRWEHGGSGDREAWQVFDPQALLHSRVDAMVEAVDPQAFDTPEHSWRSLAEDGHTGGLLA